jgi:O-antigen/teichoic acid export membrane protein
MTGVRQLARLPRQIVTGADNAMLGTVAAGIFAQLGLVVSGIIAARVLGPSDRGYLAGFQSIAVAGSFIIALGVPVAIAYYVAHDTSLARRTLHRLRGVVLLQIGVALVVPAALFITVLADEPAHARLAAWITLPLTAALLIAMYATSFLQGMQRFLAFNLLKTMPIPAYGAVLVLLTVVGFGGLGEFAAAFTVISCITAVVAVVVVRRWLPAEGEGDISRRKLLDYGIKGQIGAVSPIESFQLDFLIVGALAGPYWLGLYAGAMAFTNLPRFVAMAVGVVAFPRVASAAGTDHAIRAALNAVAIAGGFAVVVVTFLELIVGWLIPFLFGADFEPSVPLARVLLIAALLLSFRRIIGDVMRGGGAPLPSTSAEIIAWIVYGSLVVPMTHSHGTIGAAWAMTIAAAVSTAWLTFAAVRMLRMLRRPAV